MTEKSGYRTNVEAKWQSGHHRQQSGHPRRLSEHERQRRSTERRDGRGIMRRRFRTTWQCVTTRPTLHQSPTPLLSRRTSHWVNLPRVQAADTDEESLRSASLHSATLLLLHHSGWLIFFYVSSSFYRHCFSLLCPSPPPFHHTPRPENAIDCVAVLFFSQAIIIRIQISQIASARVLIISVSICSFSIIASNTFSVIFKSGDQAGQVVPPEKFFLVFNSRELSTACWCTLSLNIKVFLRNFLQQKGFKFVSKICVYFCKLILSLSGNQNLSTSYII